MEIASLKQRRCKDTSFAPFAFKLLAIRSTGRVHGIVGIVFFKLRYEGSLSSTPPFLFLSLSLGSADACTSAAIHTDRCNVRMQRTHMHLHMHIAHAARTLADVPAMSSCSHVLTNVKKTYMSTRE